MTIELTYEERIPDYSLPYLINADDSGLTPEDKRIIDDFMETYYQAAKNLDAQVIISIESEEPYFSSMPAFGLPCNVCDSVIIIAHYCLEGEQPIR